MTLYFSSTIPYLIYSLLCNLTLKNLNSFNSHSQPHLLLLLSSTTQNTIHFRSHLLPQSLLQSCFFSKLLACLGKSQPTTVREGTAQTSTAFLKLINTDLDVEFYSTNGMDPKASVASPSEHEKDTTGPSPPKTSQNPILLLSTSPPRGAPNASHIRNRIPPLPLNIPKFKFPRSKKCAGLLDGVRANAMTWRLKTNQELGLPWDEPLFEHEIAAIRKWEARYGFKFRSGCGMAEYDDSSAVEE